ncbi:hypothetical protein vseg_010189 [Gypsophila vaccaria]
MDPTRHHHHRRPSSDRFLTTFSPPSSSPLTTTTTLADDFSEDDILFTPSTAAATTTASHHHRPNPPSSSSVVPKPPSLRPQRSFKLDPPSGILAALPDPTTTTTISIVATSDHRRQAPHSLPSKYHHSAPMHVPSFRRPHPRPTFGFNTVDTVNGDGDGGDDNDDDDDDDDEMLPPHEMVARRLADTPVLSTSVLEGAGRTLKGRDLRQVRNAVFRHTGFID